ncbi:MAG: chemotaxis response regulator protein-glutamate methylesterase [Gammaproteobacteria bacterium]|nr:chemotaxis response regulator protein-glutamate methylesterase [Gammaproteobacteria bacterium]MCP5199189.1 chemotaxis response regulator protein-glutamate methylesterase [Gammaproteobacteria bacterium]
MRTHKTSVLVVDDSALIRKLLKEILSSDPDLEVVGAAHDPLHARELIKQHNPDVLTLDVEMPKMDGITFLTNLMRLRPMPVVMVSSLTEQGADVTLQALEIGAFDFVTKPKIDVSHQLQHYTEEIVAKVKAAAKSRVRPYDPSRPRASAARSPVATSLSKFDLTHKLVAIGASTGGTEAIREVLERMPSDGPAVVVTQHIPQAFSKPFAERMDRSCAMRVCQAEDGQPIVPGHAYVAPGHLHMTVERSGARYLCRLHDTPLVNRHKPSVDVMFDSVAANLGANAVGILLTGMGADGAKGMLAMHEAGAKTIAQDEKTSVVWGMPGEAVRLNAVDHVVPLDKVAEYAMRAISA